MLEYIRGKLTEATPEKAVIEIGGLGYLIYIPFNNYAKLPALGKEILLYISPYVREDCHKHFGFITREERDLFEQFHAISGIGPKTALALIGHLELSDLYFAISQKNVAVLCKIPGVGKKTAERLVVELKDRVQKHSLALPENKGKAVDDAIAALINLGYPPIRAQKAVKTVLESVKEKPELPQLITLALKQI
jgi:Holliday junction DNA helicase RuvA